MGVHQPHLTGGRDEIWNSKDYCVFSHLGSSDRSFNSSTNDTSREGVMIYKVRLWYRGQAMFEVEAENDEQAEEKATEMLEECQDGISLEVDDAVVTLSDNQYTDQQELKDRERDHEQ